MITINYAPTKKQAMFHASVANEVLYGGAAGGGKTKALVMDAFFRCMKWPNTTAVIFRRTFSELEDTDIKEALGSYPSELAKYNAGKHMFTFVNGSKVLFRHCEHEADRFNYQGIEIQYLYMDELTTFTRTIYDFLKTRIRAKKSLGVTPIVRAASNPGNIGHSWVKKQFVDACPYMEIATQEVFSETLQKTKKIRTQYIPSLATENPFITEDYIFELESKPEALRRALLNGDWDSFEGQVFTEFTNVPSHYMDRRNTHVIAPFEIPTHWKRYMSFDHGYAKPFSVGWWAVDPMGRVYRYKEWYGCEKGKADVGLKLTPAQIAAGIVAREEDEILNNIHIDRIADPAIFDRSRGDSVADQMRPSNYQKGVIFRPGDNTRLPGKLQLHQRMIFDADGLPKIYIFNTCKEWIRTVPNLPYSTTKVEDVDTQAEDHIYDETRYFLMSRPVTPKKEVEAFNNLPLDPYREEEYN